MSDGSLKIVKARLKLGSPQADLEVWCIRDLMDSAKSGSSSEEKARVIPYAVAMGPSPNTVVAVGTAASEGSDTQNGSVIIGSNVFVNDPFAPATNPHSQWTHPQFKTLVKANSPKALDLLNRDLRPLAESRFLSSTINPARPPTVTVSSSLVALSSVNVTDPATYAWADRQTLNLFEASGVRERVGSIETTHGVIRLVVQSSEFFFVSGIANRQGWFERETAARDYAQNFAASHNAAICLAWMIPELLA